MRSQYCFDIGFRFYYWPYYKHKQHLRDVDWNLNDHGGYFINQLNIDPKYENLKDEIINNTIYPLGSFQINISITKADKLMATFRAKSIRGYLSGVNHSLHYEIQIYSPLKYSQLLSLVLYTDWTDLQSEFSKSFRRINQHETLTTVKERNQEFFHWSKNLREAVEIYGNDGWYSHRDDKWNSNCRNLKGPFYCGLSFQMVIPGIMIRLN